MAAAITNASGWEQLIDGHMINAVYTMFNEAFLGSGIIVIILFLLYQFMLYQKTQNFTLMFVVGVIFTSMYGLSVYVEAFGLQIMFLIIVLELTGMLIATFFY